MELKGRSPYAIFGSKPYVAGEIKEKEQPKVFVIENLAEDSMVARLEHDTATGIVTSFDKQGNAVGQKKLKIGERAWPTQDRYARKYPATSPYVYCLNNPVNFIDPTGDTTVIFHANGDITIDTRGDGINFAYRGDGQADVSLDMSYNDYKDLQAIESGAIGSWEHMTDARINGMLSNSGVRNQMARLFPHTYALLQSWNWNGDRNAKMDYVQNLNSKTWYSRVRERLIKLARQETEPWVTYQELCLISNLPLKMSNSKDRNEISEILDEISEFEHQQGPPLLSSLVRKKVDLKVGSGFYKLSEKLGFGGDWRKLKREGELEYTQMRECIEFWSDDINYLKYKDL